VRRALWSRRGGPNVGRVLFEAVQSLAPRRVLEVGCGPGDFAQRLQDAGTEVVALDQSEQMVALARGRGVEALVGDVQALPFADGAFDLAVASFMLYHVPDLGRALSELARVAPALLAATVGYDQLKEMWELVGRDLGERRRLFMRETGAELLRAHYGNIETIDLPSTVEMSAADMRHYIRNSVRHAHLAERVPDFDGTRTISASTAVFLATTS
jgi:SAM-dependent methyltransferase